MYLYIISTVVIYISVLVCGGVGILLAILIIFIISVLVYKKRNRKKSKLLTKNYTVKKFISINKPHFIYFSSHRERFHSTESGTVSL